MKEGEGTREHICMTHRHRQQCRDIQRGQGAGWRGKWRKTEDISNSVNHKNKEKKMENHIEIHKFSNFPIFPVIVGNLRGLLSIKYAL